MVEDIEILPLFSDDGGGDVNENNGNNKKIIKTSQETIMEQLEMQQTIRENSTEISLTMNELKHFVNDIKQKEYELKYNEPSKEDESLNIELTPTDDRAHLIFDQDDTATKTCHQIAIEFKEKGNECIKRNDFQQAIEYYTNALETDKTDAAIFYSNRALCYLKLKQYYECINDCTNSLKIDPNFHKSHWRRITSYESLGDDKMALKYCEEFYKIRRGKLVKDLLDKLRKSVAENDKLEIEMNNLTRPMIKRTYTTKLDGLGKESAFIIKPPHLRSSKPLKRKHIIEIKNDTNNVTVTNTNAATTSTSTTVATTAKTNGIAIIENSNLVNGNLNENVNEKSENKNLNGNNSISKIIEPKVNGYSSLDMDFIEKSNVNQKEVSNHKNSKEMENIAIQFDKNLITIPEPPTTSTQFDATWKSLNDSYKRYLYLKNIETKNFHRLISAQFNSDICSEMLTVMNEYFIKNNEPALVLLALLTEMSKCKDSSIIGMLLSQNDKVALQNITNYIDINYFKQMNDIKSKFNV